MILDSNMKKKLHKDIGIVTFGHDENGEEGRGTGVLISDDLVLTFVDNVFDKKKGKKYGNIKFHLKVCGELGKGVSVENVFIPEEKRYMKNECALLKLTQKLSSSSTPLMALQ